MAGKAAVLTVRILTDASQAQAGAAQAATTYGRFTKAVDKMVLPATLALGAIGALGKAAADSASEQQQAFGAVESVYGAASKSVLAYADTAAKSLGLSKAAYSNAASVIGAQLQGLGFSADDAAGASNKLISMGADLAATFGGSTADAVSALSAALRGEADPAERYGLALSQTRVNAELAARGLDKLEGPALAAAKAQVILDLATQQSAGALGQFGRESDTAAGSAAIASAKWEDAQATLGQKLLPVVTAVTGELTKMVDWISRNSTVVLIMAGVIAGLAAGILILKGVIIAVEVVTKIWTAAQWLMNTALFSSPITWIVLAIVALVAIVVLIATKTTWFQDIWDAAWKAISGAIEAVWSWIKSNWPLLLAILTGPVGLAVKFIVDHWDQITEAAQTVYNWLKGTFNTVWDTIKSAAVSALDALLAPIRAVQSAFDSVLSVIKSVIDWISKIKIPDLGSIASKLNPFDKSAPVPSTAAYPTLAGLGLRTSARAASSSSAPAPTIVIQGALDPAAVARQVRAILRDDSRRRRGVVIGAPA